MRICVVIYLGENNVMWNKNLRIGPSIKLLGIDGVRACARAHARACVCVCVCVQFDSF
jgi:hypothetical protein